MLDCPDNPSTSLLDCRRDLNVYTVCLLFPCPECRVQGLEESIMDGPCEWSNHVEGVHAPSVSPSPTSLASSARPNSPLKPALLRHIDCHTLMDLAQPCLECKRSESADGQLGNMWAWIDHLRCMSYVNIFSLRPLWALLFHN
jgi:hypothetical protein